MGCGNQSFLIQTFRAVPRKKDVTSRARSANYEYEHARHRLIWFSPMDEVSTSCHLADLTSINWAMLARDHRGSGGPRCAWSRPNHRTTYVDKYIHTYIHTAHRRMALMYDPCWCKPCIQGQAASNETRAAAQICRPRLAVCSELKSSVDINSTHRYGLTVPKVQTKHLHP